MRLLSWLFLRWFGDCVPDQGMADRMVASIDEIGREDAERAGRE